MAMERHNFELLEAFFNILYWYLKSQITGSYEVPIGNKKKLNPWAEAQGF